MSDRALPFVGIDNFRDYGGYAVAGGGRLRRGRLYRSAHHGDAGDDDLVSLGRLGLAAVIDLRGPGERAKAQSRRPATWAAHIFAPDEETGKVAPHIEAAVKAAAEPAAARAATRAVYADIPGRPAMMAVLRLYFAALAGTDGPVLIHCTAGKDRTGVAVALAQAALGVHRDDILADYLLTNTVGRFEERLAAGIAMMRRNFGLHLTEEAARVLVTVEPGYIEAAFDAIDRQFGGLDPYLGELGVDAACRDAMALRLIEPAL